MMRRAFVPCYLGATSSSFQRSAALTLHGAATSTQFLEHSLISQHSHQSYDYSIHANLCKHSLTKGFRDSFDAASKTASSPGRAHCSKHSLNTVRRSSPHTITEFGPQLQQQQQPRSHASSSLEALLVTVDAAAAALSCAQG